MTGHEIDAAVLLQDPLPAEVATDVDALFDSMCNDLYAQGYSVQSQALPIELATGLHDHLLQMKSEQFSRAGIGRQQDFMTNSFVRTDEICWINGESTAGLEWLDWTQRLRQHLNRKLFLGLFSFESHYAHYGCGDFYKRHTDAFRGEANRVVSLVVYLNPDWQLHDGGELLLYRNDTDMDGIRVLPAWGTIVIFLSEEFPHEVLPAKRDRYSIAGWYRVNSSVSHRADPPR